jgi:hypothetical protein
MSFTAKDLLALAKEIKIKEKLEKRKEKLQSIKLENELRLTTENKRIKDFIFYEMIASKCINSALNKKLSCEFLLGELMPYEEIIIDSGFSLSNLGSFDAQTMKDDFPYSINNNRDVLIKNSTWSSLDKLNKVDVVSIQWIKNNLNGVAAIYPGFVASVLTTISSTENQNFNNILELIWKNIQTGKKKISLSIEEYRDGQCTADMISGVYFNGQMTSLDELQIEGVFNCLGYQTLIKELKINNKNPENLIRKMELNISWS